MTDIPAPDDGLRHLPDDARLWVFGTDRTPGPHEETLLLDQVDRFIGGWKAHGRALAAGREWRHGRFLLVGVDESVAPPTGCSIDALVRTLKGVEEVTGLSLLRKDPIWVRSGGEIRQLSRRQFRAAGAAGEVSGATVVFDPAVTRMAELRAGRWERPAADGWHATLLASAPGDGG